MATLDLKLFIFWLEEEDSVGVSDNYIFSNVTSYLGDMVRPAYLCHYPPSPPTLPQLAGPVICQSSPTNLVNFPSIQPGSLCHPVRSQLANGDRRFSMKSAGNILFSIIRTAV